MDFDEIKRIAEANEAAEAARKEDVEQYFLDYSAEIAKPVPVILDPTNTERLIVSEDNILVIAGEAKSYKSFCASLLVIDFFKQHPDSKCVIIDTEQADWNCANIGHRVCKGLGWRYEEAVARKQLRIANLRRYGYSDRADICERIIKSERPYLCIIDGVRDLVHDINDSTECTDIIDKLMRWTAEYHCAICTILHTNKDGETLRGHLGSELQNKAETVLFCKKKPAVGDDRGGVEVSSKYARNIDIETFEIEINAQFVPVRSEKPAQVVTLTCGGAKQTAALNALPMMQNTPRAVWVAKIEASGVVKTTAERYFTDFVQKGFIVPDDANGTGYTHYACKLTEPQEIQTQPLPTFDGMGDTATPF